MYAHPSISGPLYADAIATLSGLFGAPLELDDLQAMSLPANRGPLALLAKIPSFEADVNRLIEIIRGLGDAKRGVSELNTAFCLLFLGAGGPMSAPPYESAYVGNGRLFQEPAGEMIKLLRQQSMEPVGDFPEAPDHLVIELSLLEETMRLAAVTEDEADIDLVHALYMRLQHWIPAFEKACVTYDRTGFYAGAAQILSRLLEQPVPIRGRFHA